MIYINQKDPEGVCEVYIPIIKIKSARDKHSPVLQLCITLTNEKLIDPKIKYMRINSDKEQYMKLDIDIQKYIKELPDDVRQYFKEDNIYATAQEDMKNSNMRRINKKIKFTKMDFAQVLHKYGIYRNYPEHAFEFIKPIHKQYEEMFDEVSEWLKLRDKFVKLYEYQNYLREKLTISLEENKIEMLGKIGPMKIVEDDCKNNHITQFRLVDIDNNKTRLIIRKNMMLGFSNVIKTNAVKIKNFKISLIKTTIFENIYSDIAAEIIDDEIILTNEDIKLENFEFFGGLIFLNEDNVKYSKIIQKERRKQLEVLNKLHDEYFIKNINKIMRRKISIEKMLKKMSIYLLINDELMHQIKTYFKNDYVRYLPIGKEILWRMMWKREPELYYPKFIDGIISGNQLFRHGRKL